MLFVVISWIRSLERIPAVFTQIKKEHILFGLDSKLNQRMEVEDIFQDDDNLMEEEDNDEITEVWGS